MRFETRTSGQHQISKQLAGFLQHAGSTGFDVILDSLAGEYFKPCYDALNPCGRHVVFGAGALTPRPGLKLSLNPLTLLAAPASLLGLLKLVWSWLQRPRLDVLSMPGDNKGIIGFNLIWLYDKLDVLAALYQQVEVLQLSPPVVGKEFSFEELPAALAYLQSGQSVGKVVCSRGRQGC
jgi:NADPH:quinone reductase-like Zn-dependent oxidoreductase